MKDALLFILGIVLISGSAYLVIKGSAKAPQEVVKNEVARTEIVGEMLFLGEIPVSIERADTDEKRTLGLSGRESLAEGHGMLFVFDKPTLAGIWMKDMNFPIDIAWISEGNKIVWIEKGVTPETFPQIFYPKEESKYVLEVTSGFFERNFIDIGESVSSR